MKREQKVKRSTAETPEQRAKRLERNKKARARHWRKTGVSETTIRWMDDMRML